jgi:hypothetical protein
MKDAFRRYMTVQIHKIDVDKWNEGIRIQADPGAKFINDWIKKYGAEFRRLWIKSYCKDCIFCDECGHELVNECVRYKGENT